MDIGIDAMAFHGPAHYIDLSELAIHRNVDPEKYTQGLGQHKMAIATPCEDTVTLAANAARKAITKFNIDPGDIGTLVVGTETGVDHSKPVAVYVHHALGLRSNCRTYETKHACFGAMAGLTSACDWIASKRAQGSKALIIAADIARYPLGAPGEPTQGAGAVAIVVSEKPRLMVFDPFVTGDYTKHVMDFWRPLYSKVALVDGHYSIECYLDALASTIQDAFRKTPNASQYAIEQLDACFYHVPFVKMAQKAHLCHWEVELRGSGEVSEEGRERVDLSFKRRVMPWLSLNAVVGNIYTGSLFLAVLDYLRKREDDAKGKPISLFSYGSGCAASFSIAYPTSGFGALRKAIDPEIDLNKRSKLSIEEYESIMTFSAEHEQKQSVKLNPARWGLRDDFLFLGTRNHVRHYSCIENGNEGLPGVLSA
jgi:hydroxymethylglutaryl-CoA synthase